MMELQRGKFEICVFVAENVLHLKMQETNI